MPYTIDLTIPPALHAFLESTPPNSELGSPIRSIKTESDLNRFNLHEITLVQALSYLGKPAHIEALGLSEIEKKQAVRAHRYQAICLAALNGKLDSIQYLESHLTPDEKKAAVRAGDYHAILWAASNGHLETVQYLLNHFPAEEKRAVVRAVGYAAIKWAAVNGHPESLQYVLSHFTTEEKRRAIINYKLIHGAAENGHTDIIQYLESHLTAEEKQAAVKAYDIFDRRDYAAIYRATVNGHTETIQHLFNHLTPEEKKEAVQEHYYENIRIAARKGDTKTIQFLLKHLTPEEKKEAVTTCNHLCNRGNVYYESAVYQAAINGHAGTLQHLLSQLTIVDKKEVIKSGDFTAIHAMAIYGHTETLQHLLNLLTTAEKSEAVKAENYLIYPLTAIEGHTETLQYLENFLTTEEKKEAAKSRDYKAIRGAAESGHTATIQHLENHLTAEEKKEAAKSRGYKAIRRAAENGHTATIQHLESHLTDEEKKEAVKACDYEPIRLATQNGHTETLQYLLSHLTAEEKKEAVKACDYDPIRLATQNGHTETLQYLLSQLADEEKIEVIKSHNYQTINQATTNNHPATLQYLESHLTAEEKKEAIKSCDYETIRSAIRNGHTETLQYLLSQLTDEEKIEVIKSHNYQTINQATKNNHPATLQYLLSHFSAEEKKAAVKADNYLRLTLAASKQQLAVVEQLLTSSNALHYLENHHEEYGEEYTSPYVDAELARLLATKSAFESEHPNAVFDIAQEALEPTFIMLRHLIRRNSPEDHPTIAEMISIPRLHAALHLGYVDLDASGGQPAFMGLTETQDAENQLLRLAQDVGNTYASTALLAIPEVRRRAEPAHFTQTQQHELDLSALARDRESSMRPITPAQRHMAEATIAKYQTRIADAGGVDVVFDALKADLAQRYETNPATLTIDDQTYALPLNYYELQNFKSAHHLTDEQYQSALTAYHQHPVHTALRYLSKPNHWMAPDAEFVYVNEDRTERWSAFEEYISTIVYFYMAAADENTPSIDGSSVADRLTLFLNQLALIGRAHNWDPIGPNDTEHDHIQHGDKPSCFSGANQRLYQSVLNHPLLTVLTDEILNQEIRDFVRAHFQTIVANLTHEDLLTLKTDIDRLFGLTDEDMVDGATLASIRQFNVPNASREEFIAKMTNKWGQQWHNFIEDTASHALKLPSEHFSTHLAKYYASANVQSLIEQREDALTHPNLQTTQLTYSHSSTTFFAAQPPSTAPANHDLNQQEDNDHELGQPSRPPS